jgi:hypothetical protein
VSCCFRPRARVFFPCHQRPHHPRRRGRPSSLGCQPLVFRTFAPRRCALPYGASPSCGPLQPGAHTHSREPGGSTVASRHAVPAVCFDFLPRLAPVSASARDMVPPHTIAGIIYSLCATSAAAALKPSRIAARSPCTHCVPCARGGSQPHSRTERRFWISAASENSERTSRVLSLPRSRRHIAKSTVAL